MSSTTNKWNNTAFFFLHFSPVSASLPYVHCTFQICECVSARSFFVHQLFFCCLLLRDYKVSSSLHRCAIINSLFIWNACIVHFYYCFFFSSLPLHHLIFVVSMNTHNSVDRYFFSPQCNILLSLWFVRDGSARSAFLSHSVALQFSSLCSPRFLMSFSISCNLLMLVEKINYTFVH